MKINVWWQGRRRLHLNRILHVFAHPSVRSDSPGMLFVIGTSPEPMAAWMHKALLGQKVARWNRTWANLGLVIWNSGKWKIEWTSFKISCFGIMAFNSGNDKQGQTSPNYNYFGCPSLLGNGSSGRNKSPHFTFLVATVFTGIFSITESSLADKSAVPCQASFHVYAGLHCANITFTLSFTSGMVAPLWQHREAMICVFKIDRMHHFSTIRYQALCTWPYVYAIIFS